MGKVSDCCCLQLPSLLLCCRVQSCPKATTSLAVSKGVLNPRREDLQYQSPFAGPVVPRESQRLALGGISEKQKWYSVWLPAHAVLATTDGMQVPAAPALRRLLGLGGGGCLEHPGNPVTTGHLREACIYINLHTLTCTHKNLGTHHRQTAIFRLVLTCSSQQGGKANVFVPVLWRKLKLGHRGVTQSRSSSLPGKARHMTPGQVPRSWGGPASGGTKARRAPFLLVVGMNLE